jgi:hypothetical protein
VADYRATLWSTVRPIPVGTLDPWNVNPVQTTPTVPVYYRHRAHRISTGTFVYWEWTAPDPTGAHSGIAIGDLEHIVLLGVR